ncbi:MAG: hypothetical protein PUC05_03135 [Firmicutes bacterium]|nr:hypothetical protein [Bacillota bacterium]
MNYKLVYKKGDLIFEYSSQEIQKCIESSRPLGEVALKEYILDGNGNIAGIKGLASNGHGYGFDDGWREFCLKVGEEYSFVYRYTSAEGPSDWSNDSVQIILKLAEEK